MREEDTHINMKIVIFIVICNFYVGIGEVFGYFDIHLHLQRLKNLYLSILHKFYSNTKYKTFNY